MTHDADKTKVGEVVNLDESGQTFGESVAEAVDEADALIVFRTDSGNEGTIAGYLGPVNVAPQISPGNVLLASAIAWRLNITSEDDGWAQEQIAWLRAKWESGDGPPWMLPKQADA